MAQSKPLEESMLASATWDTVPRVGVVTSSFRGGKEHDGTAIAGLADPQPTNSDLTSAQLAALLEKSMELSSRATARRSSGRSAPGSDDWIVFLVTIAPEIMTDPMLLGALVGIYARQRRGTRFTIAAGAPLPAEYDKVIRAAAARHAQVRIEYVDLSRDSFLEVPATRRTFAQRNPEGIYAIAKTIRECDRIITVAPLRTSHLTGIALSTSNYWSIAAASLYGANLERLRAMGSPTDVLTDLYLHHPADYAIVGGRLHRDNAGPIRHNIVIAGSNAIAVDAVGAAVMGFDPLKLPLLDRLESRGFGVAVTDSIWTRGNAIDEARSPFQKPPEFS